MFNQSYYPLYVLKETLGIMGYYLGKNKDDTIELDLESIFQKDEATFFEIKATNLDSGISEDIIATPEEMHCLLFLCETYTALGEIYEKEFFTYEFFMTQPRRVFMERTPEEIYIRDSEDNLIVSLRTIPCTEREEESLVDDAKTFLEILSHNLSPLYEVEESIPF